MSFDISRGAFGQFRCPARGKHSGRSAERSASSRSFFERSHIPIGQSLRLLYAFARRYSYERTIQEAVQEGDADQEQTQLSSATVAHFFGVCRELVNNLFMARQCERGLIGGPGIVVQIDEAKFGRRKYQRGRLVEGHWLLGKIQDGSEDLRLEICPANDRSSASLLPLIQRHVAPGSIIHTDGWRAYQCLASSGYTHRVVNHKEEFVST